MVDRRQQRSNWDRDQWLDSRGPKAASASLLLLGLILGLAGALIYAWVVQPVVYVESSPARLREEHRVEYVLLVSQSYAADGDWDRAKQRLAVLDDPELGDVVGAQVEAALRDGAPADVVRNLAILADRLGVTNPAIAVFLPSDPAASTPTPEAATLTPSPTRTRPATNTPFPTLTPTLLPTPTPVPVYRLLRREQICLDDESAARIEVIVVDPFLEPLPGAEVIVQWELGEDNFFTGFKPEKGLGYADFNMDPGIAYSVSMAEGSEAVSGLQAVVCEAGQSGLTGGWRLTFQNTDVQQ
jgi:hypothetical protein